VTGPIAAQRRLGGAFAEVVTFREQGIDGREFSQYLDAQHKTARATMAEVGLVK